MNKSSEVVLDVLMKNLYKIFTNFIITWIAYNLFEVEMVEMQMPTQPSAVDSEDGELDAVAAEGLDVAVVHEADAPHVDHPEVGGGLLEGADVEHLVHSPSSSSPCPTTFVINNVFGHLNYKITRRYIKALAERHPPNGIVTPSKRNFKKNAVWRVVKCHLEGATS